MLALERRFLMPASFLMPVASSHFLALPVISHAWVCDSSGAFRGTVLCRCRCRWHPLHGNRRLLLRSADVGGEIHDLSPRDGFSCFPTFCKGTSHMHSTTFGTTLDCTPLVVACWIWTLKFPFQICYAITRQHRPSVSLFFCRQSRCTHAWMPMPSWRTTMLQHMCRPDTGHTFQQTHPPGKS